MVGEKQNKLIKLVEDFCDEYLNEEYKDLSLTLVNEIGERRGKPEIWASGVIYAISETNFLFDKTNNPHITSDDICIYFNTKLSKVSARSKIIKDEFHDFNQYFSIDSENLKKNIKESDALDYNDILNSEEVHNNYMKSIFGIDSTDDDEDDFIYDDEEMTCEEYQEIIDFYKEQWGEDYFKENEGYFWLIKETRIFMQALLEQAELLWANGEKDKAINQYKYMLKLNPNDNQGVRDSLFPALLELNRLDEAQELFLQYKNDFTASWVFNKLLLDIKNKLPFDAIKMQYNKCIKTNKYIVPYLLADKEVPKEKPNYYSFGDKNEAIIYFELAGNTWFSDKDSLEVLKKLNNN